MSAAVRGAIIAATDQLVVEQCYKCQGADEGAGVMSEMPERIWAAMDDLAVPQIHHRPFVLGDDSDRTEYLRADLVAAHFGLSRDGQSHGALEDAILAGTIYNLLTQEVAQEARKTA